MTDIDMTDNDLVHDDDHLVHDDDPEQLGELLIGSDFRRVITDICRATIPKKRLKNAKAMSVDQTAFESFYRADDFHKQADIDLLIKQGKPLPDGVELGPDGKLIRCADLDARTGYRTASAATGYKDAPFTGYHVTFAVLTRSVHWSGQPDALKEHDDVPPYIVNFAVDPATNNVGRMSLRVVEDALSIAPGIREVLADRGITQLGETFIRHVRQLRLDITMDLKKDDFGIEMISVGTGKHQQRLYAAEGAFYPPWLPERFKEVPEGLTTRELRDWYAKRARYRWGTAQRVDGGIQFQCPQCAGRVVTNLKTRRKNVRPPKSVPEEQVDHYDDTCCKGLATIPYDMLDKWQPIPYGTRAWKKAYNRRLQVENVNSMIKADSGLDAEICRARGLGSHTLAVLAYVVQHNLELAMTDPLADDPDDESGDSDDGTGGDHEAEANNDILASEDAPVDGHTTRAPP